MPDLIPLPDNLTLKPLQAREALAFFQGKVDTAITFNADALWQAEHNVTRTVSRLTSADLINDIYGLIEADIATGAYPAAFSKTLRDKLTKAGWWGEKEVVDTATGEILSTTFDAARVRLIYDVNVHQAFSAGRWARIERNKATHPILLYRTMRDEVVRASHARWDGLALPVGDVFWNSHYPPNGWRCRCRAYAISQSDFDSMKGTGEVKAWVAPPPVTIQYQNRTTGEWMDVPAGIDPGFGYNPGQARAQALDRLTANKLAGLVPPVAAATRKLLP